MIVAISCRLQPASESRVTAVPLRSWNVSPVMPAARVASAQAFRKLLSFHGRPVELVSMIGEVVGVASITALRRWVIAGPQFVAFDRAGNVYTTDAALDRVQKFTPDGKLLAFWGRRECRARRVRASSAEQGRYTGHGRPHRAVRGPAGPGLGQCHEQPRPAIHERREVPARPWAGRAPSPAAFTCRTGWRWTAATACTSRIR